MDLADFCDRAVVTIPIEASVREAALRLRDCDVGALVVVNGSRPIGIVTDRDLTVRALASGEDLATCLVSAVMSPKLITLSHRANLEQAIGLMREHEVRRLLIVDDGLRMCGFVSVDDLVPLLRAKTEALLSQLTQLSELISLQIGTPSRHRQHDFTCMA